MANRLSEVVVSERERDRQTDRDRDRQTDRQTEKKKTRDRETEQLDPPSSPRETETQNERTEKRNVIFNQVIAPTEGGISQLLVKFSHHFSNIALYKHTGSQRSSTKYQQNTKY